jgi:hypothetical protein
MPALSAVEGLGETNRRMRFTNTKKSIIMVSKSTKEIHEHKKNNKNGE